MILVLKSFRLLLLVLLFSGLVANCFAKDANIRSIPDLKSYSRFLLNKWMPGAPVLLAINDPRCPYCIRDLKRKAQLKNYNVFLFWAPILGRNSVVRVNEFFRCESPVQDKVIAAVIERKSPLCDGDFNNRLFQLNKQMIDSYQPNSVPQYWLGGKKVSLASLDLYRPKVDALTVAAQSPLKIDWPRYQTLSVNRPVKERFGVAVVLPDPFKVNSEMVAYLAASEDYNWYLVSNNLDKNIRSQLWCNQHSLACDHKNSLPSEHYANQEFRLLTDLNSLQESTFLLEGKRLSDREVSILIPADIQSFFNQTISERF